MYKVIFKYVSGILLLNLLTFPLSGQDFNRPVPDGFYQYAFAQWDTSYSGYFFICPHPWGNWSSGGKMALLDRNGYLAWYATPDFAPSDFKYLPYHNRFSLIGRRGPGNVRYFHLDPDFNLADSVTAQMPGWPDTHELTTLDNGNRLILVTIDTVMDLSNYTFNGFQGKPDGTVDGMGIQEFDPQGNLIWEWRSIDHIHPTEFIDNYNYNPSHFDYAHANSIEQDTDGNLLVSFRHLDAIYKIAYPSGQVIWRLGGRSSDFTFPNDPEGFSGQHTAHRLADGRIGLFDNGNRKPQPRRSRVTEYSLDTTNWTATLEFSYEAGDSIYADATGSYSCSLPGHRMISWGNARGPEPSATLLDSLGEVVAQIDWEDEIVSYRVGAHSLPFALPRPKISCASAAGAVILTAPAGHSRYMWSTGETTRDIVVADTGRYQVWVPHGIGMVGSEPAHITDLNTPCALVGAAEVMEDRGRPDEIIGYFDLLGREVRQPERGKVHVVRYRSGRGHLKVVW